MPYVRCPVCQDLFHLRVRTQPLDEWERKHVRERAADGTPLLTCFRCWVDLRPGHHVTLRSVPPALTGVLAVGDEGVVESTDGGEILVRFGATLAALKREGLFYNPRQPSSNAQQE